MCSAARPLAGRRKPIGCPTMRLGAESNIGALKNNRHRNSLLKRNRQRDLTDFLLNGGKIVFRGRNRAISGWRSSPSFYHSYGVPDNISRLGLMPETHWSVIHRLAADDTVGRDQALAEVCRTYWQPLYSLARVWGRSPQDAEDLTQAFFSSFCERGGLGEVSPERGRFRREHLSWRRQCFEKSWRYSARRTGLRQLERS